MSKALEFKKRQQKETAVQAQQATNDLAGLRRAMGQIFQLLGQIEKNFDQKLERATASAKIADWRSLAILKLLPTVGITEEQVTAKAEELQIAAFEEESAMDDITRKLETFEGPAENGLYAIARVKLLNKGEELVNSQIIRTKYELGKGELMPAIDAATIGMVPGETKRFPLALAGASDEAEIYLITLKKGPPAPELPPLVDPSALVAEAKAADAVEAPAASTPDTVVATDASGTMSSEPTQAANEETKTS